MKVLRTFRLYLKHLYIYIFFLPYEGPFWVWHLVWLVFILWKTHWIILGCRCRMSQIIIERNWLRATVIISLGFSPCKCSDSSLNIFTTSMNLGIRILLLVYTKKKRCAVSLFRRGCLLHPPPLFFFSLLHHDVLKSFNC